jgi:N utilization substance protein A
LTEYSVGDSYEEKEPLAFSRVGIAVLRDVFSQRIRDMERENFYSTLSAQLGELMKARPYKIDANGDAHLEIEGMEKVDGILMRRDMIPGEIYKPKRQILVLVKKVDRLRSGDVVVYFTRVSEDFVRKLLEKEIVEVKEGIVEVLNVARIPGERTKISVRSNDPHVDPVGACVGARGDRIRRIMKEMNNERIDVIRWDEEPKRYIANALNPLVLKDYEERVIIEDEEEKRARVVVPDRDYSTAIGRKGANVKLASLLTGWDIRVVADRENMRIREVGDLEERIIDALESAGIERVWQLLKMSRGDLMEIAGLGEGEVSRIEEWLVEKQYIVVEGEEGEEVEEVIDDE